MKITDHTVCALIRFPAASAPSFDWVSGLVLRRCEALVAETQTVDTPRRGVLVADLDGVRIVVAMDARAQLVLSVGCAPAAALADPLAGQHNVFCRMLVEAIVVAHDPEDIRWFRDFALPDADLAEALLESARWEPLSGGSAKDRRQTEAVQRLDLSTVRGALYVPAPGEAGASLPVRAALGLMTSVAAVASLPVGRAMLAWNGTQGADPRMTAAGLAGIGLLHAFGDVPLMGLI